MSKTPKRLNIPIPAIVLCFILGAWPIGVVLVLLRLFTPGISTNTTTQTQTQTQTTYTTGRASTAQTVQTTQTAQATKKQKRKENKKSTAHKLRMVAIILCSVAVICGVSTLSDLLSYGYLDHDMLFATLYMLLGGGATWISSKIIKRRERDAVRYRALIGDKESVSLTKLSAATSYKIRRVKHDVQRLIDTGEFGDLAYVDMANLCFMRTPDAVPDGVTQQFQPYSRTMSSVGADIAKNAPTVQPEDAPTTEAEETDMTDFDAILRKIRRLDDEILDEPVSERIRKIETITRNIFEYVKDKPEKMKQIRMFMNYYLPTTLKLLESYSRIERVGVAGQNMQDAKDNIEKILDMLVVGFEQQFDQLFRAESMDITSDIEVLEQMMRKDGLSGESDFSVSPDFTDTFTDEISDDLGESGAAAQARKI